jgi:hypothetical protein
MKIEVNEFYLNAIGEFVQIVEEYENSFRDANLIYYSKKGLVTGDNREFDLISHIPKELHYELIRRIQMYYKKDNYKRYVKRNYEKKVH